MARRTLLFGLMLVAACTAPPRPAEAPAPAPAPTHYARIGLRAPGLDAAALAAGAVQLVESALARVPGVTAMAARADDGRAEVIATLTSPVALEAVRAALETSLPQLPRELDPLVLARESDAPPALVLALPPDHVAVTAALEATPGVARVEVCGGRERVLTVALDRARLRDVPLDGVLAAAGLAVDSVDSIGPAERLADLPLAATPPRTLRDVAVMRETLRPQPCAAHTARGPVLLLSVFAQIGADPARVAADALARAVEPVSPTQDFFADGLPTADAPALAVLDLDLRGEGEDDAPAVLARCLGSADLPAWALMSPASADPPTAATRPAGQTSTRRARLLLAVTPVAPIESVRATLSLCAGVQRAAVLAPAADADHGMTVKVLGADPATLAAVAERAAERLATAPGVTGLRVFAARPRPVLRLDRAALAARGVAPADAAQALRLALGPVPIGGGVEIDLPDRTGAFDHDLKDIYVQSTGGPVALAGLVHADPPAWVPLYRVDREPAAALDLRLRRAADREAVQRTLAADIALPAGLRLELGPGLPALDP